MKFNNTFVIMKKRISLICVALGIMLTAINTTAEQPIQKNSEFTQGNVQMNIAVGKTTKAEILNIFGAPNITTRDGSGAEVWSYQRSAQISQSSTRDSYWTVILGGQYSRTSGFETSSKMMTLIIKFNSVDVVTDFNSRTSNF